MKKKINVEDAMVSAENAGEYIPNKDRPKPDYLKSCRMSDEELLDFVKRIVDDYTLKAKHGYYVVNIHDLIIIELVRRETERNAILKGWLNNNKDQNEKNRREN